MHWVYCTEHSILNKMHWGEYTEYTLLRNVYWAVLWVVYWVQCSESNILTTKFTISYSVQCIECSVLAVFDYILCNVHWEQFFEYNLLSIVYWAYSEWCIEYNTLSTVYWINTLFTLFLQWIFPFFTYFILLLIRCTFPPSVAHISIVENVRCIDSTTNVQ